MHGAWHGLVGNPCPPAGTGDVATFGRCRAAISAPRAGFSASPLSTARPTTTSSNAIVQAVNDVGLGGSRGGAIALAIGSSRGAMR